VETRPALVPARIDAAATLSSHGELLLRRARRFSLCADDAEDAVQRSAEILLEHLDRIDPERVVPWMLTVVGREAIAVRRLRLRTLGEGEATDAAARLPSDAPGPHERLERRERAARAARLLRHLKPHERRAIGLQAQGYSYAEIQEITGWTYTKVNRCLAEGRARLRELAGARAI